MKVIELDRVAMPLSSLSDSHILVVLHHFKMDAGTENEKEYLMVQKQENEEGYMLYHIDLELPEDHNLGDSGWFQISIEKKANGERKIKQIYRICSLHHHK